ncbi:amidohydrolase/deacetylase family metallohydrolase [Obesumbacterium proteus]|uniref:amidohydrolase/deacetylase family metallohydrolase n=1 Tax=Obesumbacterium proteus TaxID=82983 RepID=UPI001F3558EC|nr:amidohydrolase/deacetylase family metallohydrolase [Obesumbacterium proteus]MCE9886579.1 amidohydrolase/deacetylase family metallohydrolase [Obesumbacterium proteus]MCE9915460.1 amidohydrolase/deacetylase family metallohydrolase [Obesumbacterium proteus]MCE9930995.1 amidohydrolase/deacetylase family metallohydrolase [Obesumbacterium proteus]MCG2877594.1 amidohydrolase/deacetylase family metallohydrolase [Obesumbacterium proteus]
MYDLIIKQGKCADGSVVDIAVKEGKIAALGSLEHNATAARTIDLQGRYFLSAGWIDSHTHCYPSSPIYNDEPDLVGVSSGVTSVVDAGSTGADDIDEFYRLTRSAKTNVFAFLNISRIGLLRQNELGDMNDIDDVLAHKAIRAHQGFVVGIKARMSSSVVQQNGIQPLVRAKEIQANNGGLPLMVHIGNNPPNLDDIADLLTQGDIITHCYNGKPNRILTPEGELRSAVKRALDRGVLLDVGHGSASFSFDVAEVAIAQGIYPHTISSDIYCKNRIKGPVYSLAYVMSKFLLVGLSLPQIINCVTANAAQALRLPNKGRLAVGCDADFTIFDVLEQAQVFADSEQQSRSGQTLILPLAAIVAGQPMLTQDGESRNVF